MASVWKIYFNIATLKNRPHVKEHFIKDISGESMDTLPVGISIPSNATFVSATTV